MGPADGTVVGNHPKAVGPGVQPGDRGSSGHGEQDGGGDVWLGPETEGSSGGQRASGWLVRSPNDVPVGHPARNAIVNDIAEAVPGCVADLHGLPGRYDMANPGVGTGAGAQAGVDPRARLTHDGRVGIAGVAGGDDERGGDPAAGAPVGGGGKVVVLV